MPVKSKVEISQIFVAFSEYMNFITQTFLHTFSIKWIYLIELRSFGQKYKFSKFIYSEKATKFCEISTLLLSYVVPVKSKVEISQNFVAFSEYMNFTYSA